MCAESYTDKKKHEKTYSVDSGRLRFALDAHGVPQEEWIEAWHWISLILMETNGPDR